MKSKLWCDSFVVPLIARVVLTTPLGFTQTLSGLALPHSPFVPLFSAFLLGHCLCSILRFRTNVPLNDSLPCSWRHLVSMATSPPRVLRVTEHGFCQDPGPIALPTRWSLGAHGWVECTCSRLRNSMLLGLFAIVGS